MSTLLQKAEKRKAGSSNVGFVHTTPVSKHACVVIIIESEIKTEFSPETAPLICVSVSQSDLCQEANAVRT